MTVFLRCFLILIAFYGPFSAFSQIEKEIRAQRLTNENEVSARREALLNLILDGKMEKAKALTDSIKRVCMTELKRPFTPFENFALELVLGRPDSAVKWYKNMHYENLLKKPVFFPFSKDDFFHDNLNSLFKAAYRDTSYLYQPSLTATDKGFIRYMKAKEDFLERAYKADLYNFTVRSYLNVNTRWFLRAHPNSDYKVYLDPATRYRTLLRERGVGMEIIGGPAIPIGGFSNRFGTGIYVDIGFRWDMDVFRLGAGLNLKEFHPTKVQVLGIDTIMEKHELTFSSFYLRPEYLLNRSGRWSQWANLTLGTGNARIRMDKLPGKEKPETHSSGSFNEVSVGYQLVYLANGGKRTTTSMYGPQRDQTRFCMSLLTRIGYFKAQHDSIEGFFGTVGLSLGLLYASQSETPSRQQMDELRW